MPADQSLPAAYAAKPQPTPAQLLAQQNAQLAEAERELAVLRQQAAEADKAAAHAPPTRPGIQGVVDTLKRTAGNLGGTFSSALYGGVGSTIRGGAAALDYGAGLLAHAAGDKANENTHAAQDLVKPVTDQFGKVAAKFASDVTPGTTGLPEKLAGIAGNIAPALLLPGGIAARATPAAFGGQAVDTFNQDAKAKGAKLTPKAKAAGLAAGAANAALAALPIAKAAEAVVPELGSAVATVGARLVAGSAAAGAAGAGMQLASNAAEKATIDPERDLSAGVGEQALAMGLLHAGLATATHATGVAKGLIESPTAVRPPLSEAEVPPTEPPPAEPTESPVSGAPEPLALPAATQQPGGLSGRPGPLLAAEVAPDPLNEAATTRWNALPAADRNAISDDVFAHIAPQVLDLHGATGDVEGTTGGFMGEVNRSYTIRVDQPEKAADVASTLAHTLDQQSVLLTSHERVPGADTFENPSLFIDLGGKVPHEQQGDLYRAIQAQLPADTQAGFTGGLQGMSMLVPEGMTPVDLRAAIVRAFAAHPDLDYRIETNDVHVAFVTGDRHAASEPGGRPHGLQADDAGQPVLRDAGSLRDAARSRIEAALGEAERRRGPPAGGGGSDQDGGGDTGGGGELARPPGWGELGSPERFSAAQAHLDELRKFIKPEHLDDFLRAVHEDAAGTIPLSPGRRGGGINPRYVDWARLDANPDDLLGWINARARIFKDAFGGAGDDVRSWAEVQKASQVFGTDIASLVKTHADVTGEGGLAARLGALTQTALEAADDFHGRLRDFRAAVASGDLSGVEDFTAATQRLVLLESMAEGSVSETARALNFMKQLKRGRSGAAALADPLQQFADAMNNGRPIDKADLEQAIDALDKAYERGGAAGVVGEVAKMRELTFADYVNYWVTAGLLSAPKTAIKNFLGTPFMTAFQVAERYVGAGIGSARTALSFGSKERMTLAEANAYVLAARNAWHDAWRAAAHGFVTSQSMHGDSIMADSAGGVGYHGAVPFQLTRERMQRWSQDGFSLHTITDATMTVLFEVLRTPGIRPHAAFDAMHKTFTSRMQLAGLAYREAAYRSALAAPEDAARVYEDTLAAISERPTAAAFKEARQWFLDRDMDADAVYPAGSEEERLATAIRSVNIERMAADHAMMSSFQDVTPAMQKIDAALRVVPVVKWFYVPFFKTPWNLLKAGLIDRNPVLGTFMGRNPEAFRALIASARDDDAALQRGGAEGDLALARLITGGAFMSLALSLFAGGNLVGRRGQPGSPQRLDGIPEYSLRLPDGRWVQYESMDPVIGTHLGLVADMAQTLRDKDLSDDHASALVGGTFAAIRNNVLNKSTLTGIREFFETFYGRGGEGTRDKAGATSVAEGLSQTGLSLFPLSSLSRSVAQSVDPVKRDARGLIEHIQAITPYWSESLPAKRDAFGRPLVLPPGERGPFAALKVGEETTDPLDEEQARLAAVLPDFTLREPGRRFNGQEVTPAEYSRVAEVQGQLYRDRRTGMNMEEAALTLMASDGYWKVSDLRRSQLLKDVVTRYRQEANAAMKDPHSEFFMGDLVARTGAAQLRQEVLTRGLHGGRLRHRAHQLGLSSADAEQLQAVLAQ